MQYKLFCYKKQPFIAIPKDINISSFYPSFRDRIRFFFYKSQYKELQDIVSLEFQKYFEDGIIFFHHNKIIIQDITQKYVAIYADYSGEFYQNFNKYTFKNFALPHLYYADKNLGVFQYIKSYPKEYSFDEIFTLSCEIYDTLGFSHGDLHKTNLLYAEKTYIIDWDDKKEYNIKHYDFLHYYLVEVFRKFEKKTKDRFEYFDYIQKELLAYVTQSEIDQAIDFIKKKRAFKGFL